MSDLPPGWVYTTLEEILAVEDRAITDGPFGSKLATRHYTSSGARVIRLQNIGDCMFNDERAYISLDYFEELRAHEVRSGDLVIASLGQDLPRACIIPALDEPAIVKADCVRVRIHPEIDKKWVLYALSAPQTRQRAESRIRGVGRPRLGLGEIRKLPIPLPPLSEQRRIAATLEDHLSRLEAGGSLIKSLITRSIRLRKATLKSAVRGTNGNRERDFEDAVTSAQNIRPSARFDHRELHPLPKGWTWVAAEEVCTTIACGGTPRAELMHSQYGDVPFLKVYNLTQHGYIDFTVRPTFIDRETHDGQLRRSKVFPGDVLTNIVGPPLGKTVVVPDSYPEWNINQAIVVFRAGARLSPNWLALVLQAPSVLRRLQSTARATAGQFNIALSTCRSLPIPLPPAAEQDQITETVRQTLYAVTGAEQGINFCRAREGHLRRGLLAEAYAGRLVPQDPRDEPASVLVDRISAQRAAQPRATRGRRTAKRGSQKETLL